MDLCGGCNFYDIDIWEYAGEGELGTIEDMSDWLSCFAAFEGALDPAFFYFYYFYFLDGDFDGDFEGDFPAYFSLLLDFPDFIDF